MRIPSENRKPEALCTQKAFQCSDQTCILCKNIRRLALDNSQIPDTNGDVRDPRGEQCCDIPPERQHANRCYRIGAYYKLNGVLNTNLSTREVLFSFAESLAKHRHWNSREQLYGTLSESSVWVNLSEHAPPTRSRLTWRKNHTCVYKHSHRSNGISLVHTNPSLYHTVEIVRRTLVLILIAVN